MEFVTFIMLGIVFIIAGMLCGVMFNIALGQKPFDRGGVLGGIIVGVLMWFI